MHFDRIWYLLPLAAAVSLSYTASRYELTEAILRRSGWFFFKTLVVMSLIFFILYLLSRNL